MIRILLAEDDEVMRQYLTRALEKSGYEVVAVDRGTAALPLLETQRFDLLLTDIVMPAMDGIELAQHVADVAPGMRGSEAVRRGNEWVSTGKSWGSPTI